MAKKNGNGSEEHDEAEREEGARDFGVFMRGLNDGRFNGECAQELKDIVGALRRNAEQKGGKSKAKLTITLSLTYDAGQVQVLPDVKKTPPPRVRGGTWMFLTGGDNLSLQQEVQQRLPIREVRVTEAKSIAPAEAAAPKSV
jgi:hypothetical protein